HMFRHVRTLVNVFALNGELTLVRRLLRKLQDLLKALYRARFLAWDICRTYRIGPAPKFFCLVHDSLLLSMSPLGQSYSVETISCPPIFTQAYARLVLPMMPSDRYAPVPAARSLFRIATMSSRVSTAAFWQSSLTTLRAWCGLSMMCANAEAASSLIGAYVRQWSRNASMRDVS